MRLQFHPQSQDHGKDLPAGLVNHRDVQEMMLSILDETDPEARRYNEEYFFSNMGVNKCLAAL
jgi:hypothetical protein